MGRKLIVLLVVIAGIILLDPAAPPPIGREFTADCELYGTVTVRGQSAPVGTRIAAYADGLLLADTAVRSQGVYEIVIPPDDPITLEKDGWAVNDVITFTVNGETAQPPVVAFEGRQSVDLTVQLASEVRRSTWGKIKALFR